MVISGEDSASFLELNSLAGSQCVLIPARLPFPSATQTLGASLKSTEELDAQNVVFRRSSGRWFSIATLSSRLDHEFGRNGFVISLPKPLNGSHVHAMLWHIRVSIVDVLKRIEITRRL